jgi:cytochrome c-type biogenesis protein CcmF
VPEAEIGIWVVALLALGMRDGYALVAYTLAGFVAGTLVQEFARGTRARRAMYGEGTGRAFTRLIARNRRRYGGYIVHAGIVVMFAAFAGMAFRKSYGEVQLGPGETFEAKDAYGRTWTFTNQGLSTYKEKNRYVTGIALAARMNGGPMRIVRSEKRQHVDAFDNPTFEPSTEVGLIEGIRQDVYVVLAGVTNESVASLAITFNPLVVWVWIGGMLMAVGGVIVMWPAADRRRVQSGYVAVMRPEHAGADA